MKLDQTNALLARARKVIPSASQTFSKGPNQWVRGVSPHYLERGDGAWVWDADGNKFLDYLMALGPIILGYNDPVVNAAISAQLAKGAVFSQMHPLEVIVAEMLVERIPCAEMVRFGKNGSDVTTASIRAARAITGRERIAFCGYHGWHDWYIGTTTRNLGVPKNVQGLTHGFVYNDLASLDKLFAEYPGQIAAVIMEPVGVEPPKPGFLEGVRAACTKAGALLVFDEIVTGFRFSTGGVQKEFGVLPDLACFGKAMANGMPLSAVVGPRAVMEVFDEIFFSGTFGGEVLSLAACKATIERMEQTDALAHIKTVGQQLLDGLNPLIARHGLQDSLKLLGFAPRSMLAFPHADEYQARLRRSFFMQECVKRGLLYFGIHIPTYAHRAEEIRFTLDVFAAVVPIFADALAQNDMERRMEGQVVEPIFRKA